MFKSIIYFTCSILIFLLGIVVYGMLLNVRNVPLKEVLDQKGLNSLGNVNLVIDRSNYSLSLYNDSLLLKTYKASFGRNPRRKIMTEKGATPFGSYYICAIDSNSNYRKFLQISYPNDMDLQQAVRMGVISRRQMDDYASHVSINDFQYLAERTGDKIGIHGYGRFNVILKNLPFVYNWTNGSIALSDEDIDEIASVVKIGTLVAIRE